MHSVPRHVNGRKTEAILKAATRLFPKQGYEKTTMQDIATAAGVTKQTVYSYFPSKELLFTQMIDNLCRKAIDSKPVVGSASKSFELLLFDVGMKVLNLITSAEGMAVTRLVVAEAVRYPKLAKLYYESGTQRLVQLMAEFLIIQNARGVITISNTESAAAYFFSLLKGQYFLRMTLGVPPIPSQRAKRAHVREVVAIFMRVYGGTKPLHTKSSL